MPVVGQSHQAHRDAAWQHPNEILAVSRSAADFPFTSAGTEFCPRCLQMFRAMPQGPADHHAFTFYLSHFLLPRCPLLQPAHLPAPPALEKQLMGGQRLAREPWLSCKKIEGSFCTKMYNEAACAQKLLSNADVQLWGKPASTDPQPTSVVHPWMQLHGSPVPSSNARSSALLLSCGSAPCGDQKERGCHPGTSGHLLAAGLVVAALPAVVPVMLPPFGTHAAGPSLQCCPIFFCQP